VRSRVLLAVGGVAFAVALGPARSSAAGPAIQSGWWMAPVAVAPDAPARGLVVQGGPTDDVAYGAVRFTLASDVVPDSLVLTVADGSASTPNTTLALCPLTEPFTPAQGGAMADAPAYDCERSGEAAASDDGATYTFSVGGLVEDDALAVAILPTAPTDRVVLAAPGDESLVVPDGGATPPTAPTLPDFEGPPAGSFEPPPLDVGADPVPSLPPVAIPSPEDAPTEDAAPPFVGGPVSQSSEGEGSALRTLLALGLVSIAGGLWSAAGAERDDELSAPAALA
jgi:hypothetical protein